MNRQEMLARIRDHKHSWDFAVIGGGATGVGVALDAASRGYDVVLFEQADFGKGTSSRSTKLIHGGLRYLKQGRLRLVQEALRERSILRRNAPHLIRDLAFLVPTCRWRDKVILGIGLQFYDLLAGRQGFGRSRSLSRNDALVRVPTLKRGNLRGAALYHDGQFDDARFLISMVRTAVDQGAALVNYVPVIRLHQSRGRVAGLLARDDESGEEMVVSARCVINATGPFCDAVRRLSNPAAKSMIAPSQGIHVVLPGRFLGGDTALLVPHTRDGRVLFAIPWHGHVLVGTTDTPVSFAPLEPRATEKELDFILSTAAEFFEQPPTRSDVLSIFAGIRPLVAASGSRSMSTAKISRDHCVEIDTAGLVTITGGKWTTYRKMAEDCVDQAAHKSGLARRRCVTREIQIHASDVSNVEALAATDPTLATRLHRDLQYVAAEVIRATQHEMARTVEDVLARRTRALFLNAAAAIEMAPRVAELMAQELRRDETWQAKEVQELTRVAQGYALRG